MIKHITDNPPLDYSDSLYTPTSFRETFGALAIPSKTSKASSTSLNEKNGSTEKLSERDVEVLVKWLSRDTGLIVSDGSVGHLPLAASFPCNWMAVIVEP